MSDTTTMKDIVNHLPEKVIKLMRAQQKYFKVNMNKSLKNQRQIEAEQCMFNHIYASGIVVLRL